MSLETNNISNKKKKVGTSLYEWYDSILKALIIIVILITFVFKVCTVFGGSMKNTLYDGEKLVISNFLYTPKENDIIVFHQTGEYLNEPCVKRVIATGGKWVKIDFNNKTLYVSNDETFDESDIVDESSYAYFDNNHYNQTGTLVIEVPDGYLFVLGDNRNNSTDSRSPAIGLVDERTVLGKVIFRLSPSERMGIIK